ncbi:unnamed protein product [Orchesella dallaii]|uniref:Uncharacterized protein n=1 Tax=Orchesella dallaii TaxID=48710 RepID=A0ABP1PU19_9HEXA
MLNEQEKKVENVSANKKAEKVVGNDITQDEVCKRKATTPLNQAKVFPNQDRDLPLQDAKTLPTVSESEGEKEKLDAEKREIEDDKRLANFIGKATENQKPKRDLEQDLYVSDTSGIGRRINVVKS